MKTRKEKYEKPEIKSIPIYQDILTDFVTSSAAGSQGDGRAKEYSEWSEVDADEDYDTRKNMWE